MKKLIIILAMLCSSAFAKDTLKIIVPQPPGGLNDTFVRYIQKKINDTAELDLNVIVINKPGGDGLIALRETISDKSDYTMMFSGSAFLYKSLEDEENLKLAKSMIPIIQVASSPSVFIVDKTSKFKSWNDVIQYAKNNPINIGTNSLHANYIVQDALPNGNANLIPFLGDVPVLLNVRNKTLDVGMTNYFAAITQIESKDVILLASTINVNSQVAHIVSNHGIILGFYAPPSMSDEKAKRMNAVISSIMSDSETIEYFSSKGLVMNKNMSQSFYARNVNRLLKK